MQSRLVARVRSASRRSFIRLLGIAAAGAVVAGCSSQPQSGYGSLASVPVSGATVAFESIDGPPSEVFRKLVADLNEEAGSHQIAVVSRSSPAVYRIRGYVSAIVERNGKTNYAWVWDVYDADKRRAVRLSGEERAADGKRRDAWNGADDAVVRSMARNGMQQMAAFLAAPANPPALPAEPGIGTSPGVAMASARDDSPEAAGIFRPIGADDQSAAQAADPAPVSNEAPATPKQPSKNKAAKTHSAALTAGGTGTTAMAATTDGLGTRQ